MILEIAIVGFVFGAIAFFAPMLASLIFARGEGSHIARSVTGVFENRALQKVRRSILVLSLFVGAVALGLYLYSFSGPNALAAIRQAEEYIEDKHSKRISAMSYDANESSSEKKIVLHYRIDGGGGTLIGTWSGNGYSFRETN